MSEYVNQKTFWGVNAIMTIIFVAIILPIFAYFFGQLDVLKSNMYTELRTVGERLTRIETLIIK